MKRISKHAIFGISRFAGFNYVLRELHRRKLLVLCYHGVVADAHASDRFGYGNVIGRTRFAAHVTALARHFSTISLAQLCDWIQRGTTLPPRPLLVTFDDGYRNNLTQAAPILKQLGIPAVFHVSTGYIGQSRILWHNELYRRVLNWPAPTLPRPETTEEIAMLPRPGERAQLANSLRQSTKRVPHQMISEYLSKLRQCEMPPLEEEEKDIFAFLSWKEVRTLHEMGFDLASHTVEHPILSRVSCEQLERELRDSKLALERETGCKCRCIAYPNGTAADYSHVVVAAARHAGYEIGFTTIPRYNSDSDDPLQIGRFCVSGHLTATEFYGRISGLQELALRMRSPRPEDGTHRPQEIQQCS